MSLRKAGPSTAGWGWGMGGLPTQLHRQVEAVYFVNFPQHLSPDWVSGHDTTMADRESDPPPDWSLANIIEAVHAAGIHASLAAFSSHFFSQTS